MSGRDQTQEAVVTPRSSETDHYYADPVIEFFLEGDGRDDWNGGPVTAAGYYVLPRCDTMCCRPYGPFPDVPTAREWSRREKCSQPELT
jgi:hypothetical protein